MTSHFPINPTASIFAHIYYEALVQHGHRVDRQSFLDRAKRLEIGLPVEDEFCVILNWLGNTRLVHKLDQLQTPPDSKSYYQIPDLL